jgi:hypothetical protein
LVAIVVVVVADGTTTVVTVVLLDEDDVDEDVVDDDDVVVAPAAVVVGAGGVPLTVNPVVASWPLGLWAWSVAEPGSAQLVLAGAVHAAGMRIGLAFEPLATAMVTGGRVPCTNLT